MSKTRQGDKGQLWTLFSYNVLKNVKEELEYYLIMYLQKNVFLFIYFWSPSFLGFFQSGYESGFMGGGIGGIGVFYRGALRPSSKFCPHYKVVLNT